MSDYHSIRYTDPLIGTYIRRYRDRLETGKIVAISSLLENYRLMAPALHRHLADRLPDHDALNYAATRLPPQIFSVKNIILATSVAEFKKHEYDILTWTKVKSLNRRRLTYLNSSQDTLAFIINSDSDIDDIVNNLVAYQIEHLKIGKLLKYQAAKFIANPDCRHLGVASDCYNFLTGIFDNYWSDFLLSTDNPIDFNLTLLPTTESQYLDNCHHWWQDVSSRSLIFGLNQIPVYFVSSNSHSLVNVIGGFLHQKQNYIFDFICKNKPDLYQQWFESKTRNNTTRVNDFIYYVSHNFLTANPEFISQKAAYETKLGIKTIHASDTFPTDVQIIPVSCITTSPDPDPNLIIINPSSLANSRALIINIQYPLGIAAYYLLRQILGYFDTVKGIYIMGKAAILNGNIGDIQIPNVIFDEVTNNIFNFDNIFNHYFPFDSFISNVFTAQKAVCVYGTFLENKSQLENYMSTNVNIVEMENGNYLTAILEKYQLNDLKASEGNRYQLENLPLDLGIINYASDNPLTQNLGQESVNFHGIESTYLATLATIQRIIDLETGVK